jgi:hypothetical protein
MFRNLEKIQGMIIFELTQYKPYPEHFPSDERENVNETEFEAKP